MQARLAQRRLARARAVNRNYAMQRRAAMLRRHYGAVQPHRFARMPAVRRERMRQMRRTAHVQATRRALHARAIHLRLSAAQHARIRRVFRRLHVRRLARVGFNIAVGVTVPRTVVLYPVPPAIVAVVPEFSGFEFFLVDGLIVVVDPVTLQIVDVIPV